MPTAVQTGAYPSRLFPSGKLDLDGEWPIPSREAAAAVDRIYPASEQIRQKLERFVVGETLDIITLCAFANMAYALISNDANVRNRLINMTEDESLLGEIPLTERQEDFAIFLTTDSFRHLLAKAVCGADEGQHTTELTNMIVILASGDKMVSEAVMRALVKGRRIAA